MTSLFSTAYWVRKSNESPARVPAEAASIEQDSLAPHPAARQGASRARNCAAKSVFSFDGSTAVFFLGRQKENGGGKPSIFIDAPPCLGNEKREEAELPLFFVFLTGRRRFWLRRFSASGAGTRPRRPGSQYRSRQCSWGRGCSAAASRPPSGGPPGPSRRREPR